MLLILILGVGAVLFVAAVALLLVVLLMNRDRPPEE
jgi:hypothetical protein